MRDGEAEKGRRAAVTGHRVLPELDLVDAAVATVLDELGRHWAPPRIVVSSLAEGADRLVAKAALARTGWRLTAVLPLDRADYATDFATDSSTREFVALLDAATEIEQLPPQPSRDDAYHAAGLRVVAHADLLIALWDGAPARGRGGTGDVVAHARARGTPLAWIHTADGTVTKERWPWVP